MEYELFFWLEIFGALFLWAKHHVAKLPGLHTLFHSYNKKQQISSTKRCRETLFSDNIGEFH